MRRLSFVVRGSAVVFVVRFFCSRSCFVVCSLFVVRSSLRVVRCSSLLVVVVRGCLLFGRCLLGLLLRVV